VTGWFVGGWGQPIYYDYGGNVYYQDNAVYVDGQAAGSDEQYAQQVAQIADSVPKNLDEEQIQWLPLGVFALIKEDQDDPTMFLQLAVSKEGVIGGTYNNTITGSALSVQGMVDKKTQRAVWTIGDKKNTTLETGIYNLTQEETPVLIHFGTEETQQWLLVRLEEPPETESP
jgi:hypothetical protein